MSNGSQNPDLLIRQCPTGGKFACARLPVALGWPRSGDNQKCEFWESWRLALRCWQDVAPGLLRRLGRITINVLLKPVRSPRWSRAASKIGLRFVSEKRPAVKLVMLSSPTLIVSRYPSRLRQ